jgi:hypothetical protein
MFLWPGTYARAQLQVYVMFVHLLLMTACAVTYHVISISVFIEMSDGVYLESFVLCVTLYEGQLLEALCYKPECRGFDFR